MDGHALPSVYLMQSTLASTAQRALHTGVLWLDMLIAVVLAALVGTLVTRLSSLPGRAAALAASAWRRWRSLASGVYTREFTLVTLYSNSTGTTTDNVLSTPGAYTLFYALTERLPSELCEFAVSAPEAVAAAETGRETSRATRVYHMPPNGVPIAVAGGAVELEIHRETQERNVQIGDGKGGATVGSKCVTRVVLRSRRGAREIDAFLRECVRQHDEASTVAASRLRHYTPQRFDASDNGGCVYEAADLEAGPRDEPGAPAVFLGKTFETLFIPEGARLRSLLDDFGARRGRFGRRGLPWRLGFLFSGLPGCGKTSAIEALAHALGRSVVNVPLSRVRTAAQLRSLFMDETRHLTRVGTAGTGHVRVPYDRAIYVLEDVDAAGDVVLRRDRKGPRPDAPRETDGPAPEASTPPRYPDMAAAAMAMAAAIAATSENNNNGGGGRNGSKNKPASAASSSSVAHPEDQPLTLADVLELLDGVVKMPGRIVVLTTNHPERLDPALLRPGRVDMHVHFGKIRRPELRAMLAYHYPGAALPPDDDEDDALPDGLLTPAEVERAVIQHTELSDVLAALATAAAAATSP